MSLPDFLPLSRQRRSLVFVVDALFISIPITIAAAVIAGLLPSFGLPAVFKWLVVVVLVALTTRRRWYSPGAQLLGLVYDSDRGEFRVRRDVFERQSRYTLFVATLFLYLGSYRVSQWSMYGLPPPLFGETPSRAATLLATFFSAGLTIAVAVYVFRGHLRALWLGMPLCAVTLTSIHLSKPVMADWIAQTVVARRKLQGLDVRPGEIEKMQDVLPALTWWSAIAVTILLLATSFWLVPSNRRHRR